jgi:hypothetical protein
VQLHDAVAALHQILSPLGVDPRTWSFDVERYMQTPAVTGNAAGSGTRRIATEACPNKSQLLATLRTQTYECTDRLISDFRESCVRARLEQRARETFTSLKEFIAEPFFENVERRFFEQKTVLPAISTLREKILYHSAIQRFNFFKGRLSVQGGSALEALASATIEGWMRRRSTRPQME